MAEQRSVAKQAAVAVALLVICAAVFLVPSAWAIARGWPLWLAATIGALAFPVLPIAWHIVGERKRARAESDKASTLTRDDRLLLRIGAVACLLIVPLLVLDRAATWSAIKSHGAWPLTAWSGSDDDTGVWMRSLGPVQGDARMLRFVPADAELVVWIKSGRALRHGMSGQDRPAGEGDAEELLFSLKPDHMALVARAPAERAKDIDIDDIRKSIAEDGEDLVVHRPESDLIVGSSPAWKRAVAKPSPPPALVQRLPTEPADAFVVAAAAPKEEYAGVAIERASGWAGVRRGGLYAEVRAVVPGGGAAARARLLAVLADLIAAQKGDCKPALKALTKDLRLAANGDILTARLDVEPAHIIDYLFCSFGGDSD